MIRTNSPVKKADDDLDRLFDILPPRIKSVLAKNPRAKEIIEIVLDLGKLPEARFEKEVLYLKKERSVDLEDIKYVTDQVGEFTADNRAGIERTLHRISGIRNRFGRIIGLTLRVGRAIYGTIDIVRDVVESGKSILFLGPPGIGKTTKLREAARILAEDLGKRVVVVDTSNEIAGDGDIPHPGIGRARRMQVSSPDRQHAVMIEAVENHMPEVVIIDEIGTHAEAAATRTIAERGVQLIGTAHGTTIDNVLNNPTLSDLLGGIQTVILGDEEAKRRRTQKAILERKAPPTFDIVIEIREKDTLAVYHDSASAVDMLLRGKTPRPEIRLRTAEGKIEVTQEPSVFEEAVEKIKGEYPPLLESKKPSRIYPFAVNRRSLERAIRALRVPAVVVDNLNSADIILTTKSRSRPGAKIVLAAEEHGLSLHVLKSNTSSQIQRFLRYFFKVGSREENQEMALHEAEEAVGHVLQTGKPQDLAPQNAYIRRLQHQLVDQYHLRSESLGEEPKRRLRVYPAR